MSHRRSRALPASLLLVPLATALLAAAPARAERLSLTEAVARATVLGYDARIARLETGRAVDASAEARAVYLPQITVTSYAGWSNRMNEKLELLDHQGQPRTYGLATIGQSDGWFNFVVDQVVLDLARWRAVESVALAAEVARVREEQQRETIAYEVTRLYSDLLRAESLAADAAQRVEEAQWLDVQSQLLFDAGRLLQLDRDAVALHLEETRLDTWDRKAEARDAHDAIRRAIHGSDAGPETVEADPMSLPEPVPPANLDSARALLQSPELRVLELQKRIEETKIAAARAARYPTLNVFGGYSHYGINRFDSYDDEVLIGLDFRLPLFSGFETTNAIRGARKSAEIARLRFRAVLDNKRARVRELVRLLESATERAPLLARRAAAAAERMRLADLNMRAGRGTVALALSARAGNGVASANAIGVRYDRVRLWASLQREIGLLSSAIGVTEGSPPLASALDSATMAPTPAQ